MSDDIFAGLEDDLDARGGETKRPAPTFPCGECGGSGVWRGGTNRRGNSKCFACNGKGRFKTSHADRLKARDQARARKASKLQAASEAFEAQYPGLIAELRAISSWNSFAASLCEYHGRKGALTEGQAEAALRTLAKIAARKAEREAKREAEKAAAPVVELSPIREMFARAVESGLKRPSYRAYGLVISRAPDHGRNSGCLYVKTAEGNYEGKITPDGRFLKVRDAGGATLQELQRIAVDPEAAAVDYGRVSGSCAMCGRELTDPKSVDRGIGPICAAKFGF